MNHKKLYDPSNGQMRIAGLISGSGSNLVKIIEAEKKIEAEKGKSPFHVAVIFSDNHKSNAQKIGNNFDIPVIIKDIKEFYAVRGQPILNMSVRKEFDLETVQALLPYDVSVAVYAGYMSVATEPLITEFLGINVHPANLTAMVGDKRKFTGDNAVRDAILAEEEFLRSSTHIVEEKVDYGRITMISQRYKVDKNLSFDENQNKLKVVGDWIIFPKTLLFLSEGRYEENELGELYFDGEAIPNGLKLD